MRADGLFKKCKFPLHGSTCGKSGMFDKLTVPRASWIFETVRRIVDVKVIRHVL